MSEMGLWIRFVAAILTTWRLAHLLAYEDGPADLILGRRRRAGRLLECFNFISIWVAAPLTLFVTRGLWELPLSPQPLFLPLALCCSLYSSRAFRCISSFAGEVGRLPFHCCELS